MKQCINCTAMTSDSVCLMDGEIKEEFISNKKCTLVEEYHKNVECQTKDLPTKPHSNPTFFGKSLFKND